MRLSDLRAAPYNPRRITREAASGLRRSIEEFGDISGIVFNRRTGHLVAGHQRVEQIREKYGDLEVKKGAIVTPDGHRFTVREVDWDEATEKAANVAANNPHIAGEFDEGLNGLLAEIQAGDERLFEELRLDELGSVAASAEVKEVTPPSPPRMTWALVGIPTPRFGEVAEHFERIAEMEGVFCEVRSSDVGAEG